MKLAALLLVAALGTSGCTAASDVPLQTPEAIAPDGGTPPPPDGGTQVPPAASAAIAPDGGTPPPPDGGTQMPAAASGRLGLQYNGAISFERVLP